ncbi:hypothetical protein ACU8NH_13015 [Rhizobium leguminosarum]|jgi:hypothetical protein|uniref:Uncharacterized protein n=2 Tax=Rhizobium leguminosarum TaxID=384 RepID=A0A1B8R3F4_RHILT|nr:MULTISPECIES: hypothetical protein [Rhizobium]MDH6658257.1 hypothetical protein [Rhizobium sophorae]AOO93975.1 hypothetical protein [Rhizobium leguminosarum bv. trifolii]AXA38657.1 putative integral membrane protein [Rhizobium leguminosarum]MBA8834172.1 hypothetical protein [Rhizobium leguminosarum]MBA9029892.1 hypothetical protein [Rhizobium leguminosarum]
MSHLIETPAPARPKRPFLLRRGPMETIATVLIGLGFLMLFQPFLLVLYTYSLVTLLAGTVMFIIVSKFPE